MSPNDADVEQLRARLSRYPPERYPVQHATAAFHLGALHLQRGRDEDAITSLRSASDHFRRVGMRVEQAKALVMLGAGLRGAGDRPAARAAFEQAAALLAGNDSPAEEGAARYNLGLVLRDDADPAAADRQFAQAYELFTRAGRPAAAGSASRERGAGLLLEGRLDEAAPLLQSAMAAAVKAGDAAALGAAANALGLVHLARDDVPAATERFLDAVGAHPRTVRPVEYAMAKANLALARERGADIAGARLAALQAAGTPDATDTVLLQARAVLARVGPARGDELFLVLAEVDVERWQPLIRDEVVRWVDAEPVVRRDAARFWVAGQLADDDRCYDLAEALLGVLLELPPADYGEVIAAVVAAAAELDDTSFEQFRSVMRSAMARYPIPQWQRIAAGFDRAAAQIGAPRGWS